MFTPKGYTTIGQIQNYLLTDIDLAFQTQVNDWIAQVEKYIDQKTGRNFVADATDSIRSYDGNGISELLIDDCVSITKIEIRSTDGEVLEDDLVAGTDYFLEPSNETPKNQIRLYGYIFSKGIQNIKITGKWGFSSTVPADIMTAATVLVANIINFSNQSDGEIQSMAVGRYTVSFKDKKQIEDFEQVEEILDSYKKYEF
jgi:hypothetical protein